MGRDALVAFANEQSFCWMCDGQVGLQIHHIAGRRGKDPHDRRNLCRLCDGCHRLYHDGSRTEHTVGLEHILYAKKVFDPAHYDPAYLAGLRGKKHLGVDPVRPEWWPYEVRLSVSGKPIPQPRSRITRRGPPRAYVPKAHAVHGYRERLRNAAREAGCYPTDRPVAVRISAVFRRAASHFGAGRVLKPSSPVLPIPDIDNVAKAVLDALTGVAYQDDRLVQHLSVAKAFSDSSEYTVVEIAHAV